MTEKTTSDVGIDTNRDTIDVTVVRYLRLVLITTIISTSHSFKDS